jgi:hypothetical protein
VKVRTFSNVILKGSLAIHEYRKSNNNKGDDRMKKHPWGIALVLMALLLSAPVVFAWNTAGDDERDDVNAMLIQPFINYNLPDGWYLVSAPIITANWGTDNDNT